SRRRTCGSARKRIRTVAGGEHRCAGVGGAAPVPAPMPVCPPGGPVVPVLPLLATGGGVGEQGAHPIHHRGGQGGSDRGEGDGGQHRGGHRAPPSWVSATASRSRAAVLVRAVAAWSAQAGSPASQASAASWSVGMRR